MSQSVEDLLAQMAAMTTKNGTDTSGFWLISARLTSERIARLDRNFDKGIVPWFQPNRVQTKLRLDDIKPAEY